MTAQQFINEIKAEGGFISQEKLTTLAGDPASRLTAPRRNARHFMAIIDAQGADYVRDVSLPAGTLRPVGDWPRTPHFDPRGCGGSFDGTRVTSDADPGL